MKMLKTALLAGAFFAVTTSQAQTVQEIVNKHNAAVGGVEAWGKITSFKGDMTLTVKANNMSVSMSYAVVKDKVIRFQQDAMGQSNTIVMTPTYGWSSDGSKTKDAPADKVAALYNSLAEEITFTDELVDATQKKYKMELQGKEQINGKDAYKISVIDADADETIYYVDASSYQIVRQVQKTEEEGEEVETVTDLSDFKKIEPLGITVAMTMTDAQKTTKMKNVSVNSLKEDDPLFKRPATK